MSSFIFILPLLCFGGLGFAITFLLIPVIKDLCLKELQGVRTAPELHHVHKAPVPRLGGIALASAFLAVQFVLLALYRDDLPDLHAQLVVLGGALGMFTIGLLDDLKPIGARKKFLLQLLVATIVCALGLKIQVLKWPFTGTVFNMGIWAWPITVLWLVGLTNLINLVDGADGLAGGISLMLMVLFVCVGGSAPNLAFLAAGMSGALLGFLYYNFPPAKIYMGDGGAYFLGFLIAAMAMTSSQKGTVAAALISPLFVLALPIVDTILAILRRGARGLPIFRPDRKHIHHRLSEMGFSRRKVVLWVYGVSLVFLLLGLGVFWSQGRWLPIMLGVLVLVLVLCAVSLKFSREWFSVGWVLGNSLEMRREIQFVLSIHRWLEMQAERCESLASLWQDFLFVTKKIGFTHVKVTLEDGERSWSEADAGKSELPCPSACHQFLQGNAGAIELKAYLCSANAELPPGRRQLSAQCGMVCPCIADAEMFQILSELTAEAWFKAIKRWQAQHQLPLRFDSQVMTPSVRTQKGKWGFHRPAAAGS